MNLDKRKQLELGLDGGEAALTATVMKYTVGVVLRERERLARGFEQNGMGKVAAAIRDSILDDHVFKWNGPEQGLNVPPRPFPRQTSDKTPLH